MIQFFSLFFLLLKWVCRDVRIRVLKLARQIGFRSNLPKKIKSGQSRDYLEGVSIISRLINGRFTTISCNFFGHLHYIFHKIEIQTVILRFVTVLKLYRLKSSDTNEKDAKTTQILHGFFFTKTHINESGDKYLRFLSTKVGDH